MRYVILGAGPAGMAAAEAIRELDFESEILMVTRENVGGYSKPLISYLLGNTIGEENMFYRSPDFLDSLGVSLKTNFEVLWIDTKEKKVIGEGENGEEYIGYDKLLIATGGKPFIPKIEGLGKDGIFTFTTFNDVYRMRNYIQENRIDSVVILGGGLIGLKTAEALLNIGVKVKIVELANRILANTFDEKASDMITKALKDFGCDVYTEDTVVQIKGGKRVNKVVLKSGKEIKTHMLVIAIGVRPNIDFLKKTGIKVDGGIIVDDRMRTNVEDIYAAGDCVKARNLLTGERMVIAIWPLARIQGKVAGYNMAGREEKYPGGIPMNSVELAGIPTISAGMTSEKDGKDHVEILKCEDEEKGYYKKIVLKDGKIVGFVFVGDVDRAGIYTGMILNGVDVSSLKSDLLKENFGLIYLPKEYREKLLEGESRVWLE